MGSVAGQTDAELAALTTALERQPASAVVEWAVDAFSPRLLLATSMTDAVLVDLAVRVDPAIEVLFIDTGYHFPETLRMVEVVRRRYGLNLRLMTAEPPVEPPWRTDPETCCSPMKIAQLERALVGKEAWMSGLRRADSPERAATPVVGRDGRGLVKVNPIATWSDEDVRDYIAEHDVPVNPLVHRGYLSIGCSPCTRPVGPDEPPRSGRWDGTDRTECGLHI